MFTKDESLKLHVDPRAREHISKHIAMRIQPRAAYLKYYLTHRAYRLEVPGLYHD